MFQGIPISVENREGSVRKGVGPDGPWQTKMQRPYGYIRGTKKLGMDGQELDVFLGPDEQAKFAYLIMTKTPPAFQKDDELKIMLGYSSPDKAKKSFLQHFDNPKFFGRMKIVSMEKLQGMLDGAEKIQANLGEPQIYDGGMGHIEPDMSKTSPPSLKKPYYVPSPSDPRETDDKFGDVTRRKSAATKARRDSLTRQHTDQNMKPLSSTHVSGFPSGTVGGFG